MGMFSIYDKNGKFVPGHWVIDTDLLKKKVEKEVIIPSEVYQEGYKNLPVKEQVSNEIINILKDNWELTIIGLAALIVLIRD